MKNCTNSILKKISRLFLPATDASFASRRVVSVLATFAILSCCGFGWVGAVAFIEDEGTMEIHSFGAISATELGLVFSTPFGSDESYDHIVEHSDDLAPATWTTLAEVTMTSLADGIYEARFPLDADTSGFYRVMANPPGDSSFTVHVKDFGAVADDGACDVAGITAALAAVQDKPGSVIIFDAGVYNLHEDSATRLNNHLAMIHLRNLERITMRGATTPDGDPATILQMNLALGNDVTGATHIDIRNCRDIRLKNLILDHSPRFATAAEIVAVNRNTDVVEIEVFPGMPHFDGMMSYSANNWDLDTRLLIRGPALTIGLDQGAFRQWSKVAGQERRYRIAGAGFANLVETGEGISFHFNLISGDARTMDVYGSEDLVFENMRIHSTIGMSVGAGDNRNMTFRRFHIKPEGNSLAVGPRDGIHISRSTGRLLMDEMVIKGVRWDPIVSYTQSRRVEARAGDASIQVPTQGLVNLMPPDSEVIFWTGTIPHHAVVLETGPNRTVTFTAPLPASVVAGTHFTPEAWRWDEAIIRNSLVEANFGTALVFQSANLLVEDNVFRNNSYSNIGLGPTSGGAGVFAWNIVIRNNLFEHSTWVEKYPNSASAHRGTITMFQNHPDFNNQAYNRNILIEDNTFRDLDVGAHAAAVHVKNARDVTLRRNQYENVNNGVIVNPNSTQGVDDQGPLP